MTDGYEMTPEGFRVKQTPKGPKVHPDDLMLAIERSLDNGDVLVIVKDFGTGSIMVANQNSRSSQEIARKVWNDCDEWGNGTTFAEAALYAMGVPWSEEHMREARA